MFRDENEVCTRKDRQIKLTLLIGPVADRILCVCVIHSPESQYHFPFCSFVQEFMKRIATPEIPLFRNLILFYYFQRVSGNH